MNKVSGDVLAAPDSALCGWIGVIPLSLSPQARTAHVAHVPCIPHVAAARQRRTCVEATPAKKNRASARAYLLCQGGVLVYSVSARSSALCVVSHFGVSVFLSSTASPARPLPPEPRSAVARAAPRGQQHPGRRGPAGPTMWRAWARPRAVARVAPLLRARVRPWQAVAPRAFATDGGDGAAKAAPVPRHWLDVYFPKARPWLEAQNRKWWMWTMRARCRCGAGSPIGSSPGLALARGPHADLPLQLTGRSGNTCNCWGEKI